MIKNYKDKPAVEFCCLMMKQAVLCGDLKAVGVAMETLDVMAGEMFLRYCPFCGEELK